ncbi:MAG TPA: hypothetical protein VFV86_06040, partial [Nitrososphaeraceae archaeon]|nr:hypothetical protein [Nitrososphaeraceae archaeon]
MSILLSHSIISVQNYSLTFFILAIVVSLLTSAGILSILVIKFMRWYMNNRNLSLLLFSFTFVLFYIGLVFGLAAILNEADNRTSLVISIPPFDKYSFKTTFYMNIFTNFSYFVFGLTWLATSLFLKRYIMNYLKNKEKYYWLIVSLPLIFYLTSTPLMKEYFDNFVNQN